MPALSMVDIHLNYFWVQRTHRCKHGVPEVHITHTVTGLVSVSWVLTCCRYVDGILYLVTLGSQLLRIWNVCHQSQLGGSETEWLPFYYIATLPGTIPIRISLHYAYSQPPPQDPHNPTPQDGKTYTTWNLFRRIGLAVLLLVKGTHCFTDL